MKRLRIMSYHPIARTEKCRAHLNTHRMGQIIKWCNKIKPQTLVCVENTSDKTKLRETPKTLITSQKPRRSLVMVKNQEIYGQSAANRQQCRKVQRLYGFGR